MLTIFFSVFFLSFITKIKTKNHTKKTDDFSTFQFSILTVKRFHLHITAFFFLSILLYGEKVYKKNRNGMKMLFSRCFFFSLCIFFSDSVCNFFLFSYFFYIISNYNFPFNQKNETEGKESTLFANSVIHLNASIILQWWIEMKHIGTLKKYRWYIHTRSKLTHSTGNYNNDQHWNVDLSSKFLVDNCNCPCTPSQMNGSYVQCAIHCTHEITVNIVPLVVE